MVEASIPSASTATNGHVGDPDPDRIRVRLPRSDCRTESSSITLSRQQQVVLRTKFRTLDSTWRNIEFGVMKRCSEKVGEGKLGAWQTMNSILVPRDPSDFPPTAESLNRSDEFIRDKNLQQNYSLQGMRKNHLL